MKKRSDESGPERLNYYNYYTEVEEEFVRRRGAHMLISPMDWALVESWKTASIPLHVVLRGINQAFDSYDSRPLKYNRRVNTIFFCQQAVEEAFVDYKRSQVGADSAEAGQSTSPGKTSSSASQSVFSMEMLLDFLTRSDRELSVAASRAEIMEDAAGRARERLAGIASGLEQAAAPDAEAIEHDLDSIDRMLLETATASCTEEEMDLFVTEAEAHLRVYRKKMDRAIYRQTVDNFIARRIREKFRLPRLSLFYM